MSPQQPNISPLSPSLSDEGDEINLLELFDVVLDNRWLIVAVAVCATALGGVYAFLSTPVYEANTLIQVEESKGGNANSLLGDAANRVEGQGIVLEASQTYIHAPHRPVVALGTHDLIIIDTPDALLVAARSHVESVRTVVAELEARDSPQADLHRKVARPWGWYDSIDAGERFQVKRIVVKPGASLSLQKHHHRTEHWIVVKGTAEVTCGAEAFLLTENQSTCIPIGEVHRLHNPGKTDLEMIEVQSGSYLGEDDIVRFDDVYGRAVSLNSGKSCPETATPQLHTLSAGMTTPEKSHTSPVSSSGAIGISPRFCWSKG